MCPASCSLRHHQDPPNLSRQHYRMYLGRSRDEFTEKLFKAPGFPREAAHKLLGLDPVKRHGFSQAGQICCEHLQFHEPLKAPHAQSLPSTHKRSHHNTPQTWRTTTAPLPCERASSSATLCWDASRWSCESALDVFPAPPTPRTALDGRLEFSTTKAQDIPLPGPSQCRQTGRVDSSHGARPPSREMAGVSPSSRH